MRALALLMLGLALAGCHTANPYQDVQPVAPASQATPNELATYPAAPIDYGRMRSWAWQADPIAFAGLEPEQLREIVGAALDQRGLRPAATNRPADLLVFVAARLETRLHHVYEPVDYRYPTYRHPGYHPAPLPRTYTEQVVLVQMQLHDASSGRLIWEGQAERRLADNLADTVRNAVAQALNDYPPR